MLTLIQLVVLQHIKLIKEEFNSTYEKTSFSYPTYKKSVLLGLNSTGTLFLYTTLLQHIIFKMIQQAAF